MKFAQHLLLVCLAGVVLGCGQKGPLVMPDAQKHKRTLPTVPGAAKPPSGGGATNQTPPSSGSATSPASPAPSPSPSPTAPPPATAAPTTAPTTPPSTPPSTPQPADLTHP